MFCFVFDSSKLIVLPLINYDELECVFSDNCSSLMKEVNFLIRGDDNYILIEQWICANLSTSHYAQTSAFITYNIMVELCNSAL